jgi:ComF family protein
MFLFYNIINWLFPPLCVHCQREGAWLCAAAERALRLQPARQIQSDHKYLNQVIVRGNYDHPLLAAIIQRLKYHYWSGLAEILPTIIQPACLLIPSLVDALIVPVPLHARRRRHRGFNQSQLIAQAVSQVTGWPVAELLRRRRATKSQAQLTERARHENVRDAFTLKSDLEKVPPCVIIADDVYTTGATINECAAVLRQAGVKKIIALTLAKG